MDTTIDIHSFDGKTERVEAIPTSTPGLAVTRAIFREQGYAYWNVTHTGTGKRLPGYFETSDQAVAFANDLSTLADWTTAGVPNPIVISRADYVDVVDAHRGRESWELKPNETATA